MKRTADVVIIGGGCMGASVAYHLTRRGVTDIVVLEREKLLGTGSTGRNAGGVRHQYAYLFLLASPASVAMFEKNVALQRSLGVDVQWLDAGAAERLAPGLDAPGVVA